MKGYLAIASLDKVEEIEVSRVTDRSYWEIIRGKEVRRSISSGYGHFFSTKDEAINYLLISARKKIERYNLNIQHCLDKIEKIKKL